MTARTSIRAAFVLAVVGTSLGVLTLDLASVSPHGKAWKLAASAVREGYREGDCVVFDPPWAMEGAPLFEGLDVVTTESVDWYEVGKCGRVWVVAPLGLRRDAVPPAFEEKDAIDGDVDVALYLPRGRGELLFDFLGNLRRARVSRVDEDRTEKCTNFIDGRWYCGGVHRWRFVGRHTRDIAGAEREVIWAHPLENGNVTVIDYDGVPRGGKLVVHFGLSQRAIETGEGGPVTFAVTVDGKMALDEVLAVRDEGWFEREIDVGPGKGAVNVRFTVSTPDNKDRQFCFTADMWGGGVDR